MVALHVWTLVVFALSMLFSGFVLGLSIGHWFTKKKLATSGQTPGKPRPEPSYPDPTKTGWGPGM